MKYLCNCCGHWFRYEYLLIKHKSTHERPMNYMCSFCGNLFKSRIHLRKHEVYHTHVECFVCGLTFQSHYALKRHKQALHKPTKKKPFPCDACPKSFMCRSYFKVHAITVHDARWCDIKKRPLYDHLPGGASAVAVGAVEKCAVETSADSGFGEESSDSGSKEEITDVGVAENPVDSGACGDASAGAQDAYPAVSVPPLPYLQYMYCPCAECESRPETRPMLPNQFNYQRLWEEMPLCPVLYCSGADDE